MMSAWLTVTVLVLVYSLCAFVQVNASCNEKQDADIQTSDIQLILNCTTQYPKAQLKLGESVVAISGILIQYNCSYGNTSSFGQLLDNEYYGAGGTTASLQTESTPELAWGAECVFSGCYNALDIANTGHGSYEVPHRIPTALCTVQPPVECAVNCSRYATCVGTECVCSEGLVPMEDGNSCLNVTDCARHSDEPCYHCVEGNTSCGCSNGFRAVPEDYGLLSCQDINECFVNNGDCMGDCVNTAGSFLCVCSQGHRQLENGSCVLVTTLPTSSTLTTHTTATTTKEGLTLLVLLLLIPLMAVLLLLVMSVAAVTTCKRKRVKLHRFEPKLDQKLVDELPIDITAATFVEADEASLFDVFLPRYTTPVTHTSSIPRIVDDDIYQALHDAHSLNPDSKSSMHHSEPHLAAKPHPVVTTVFVSSVSELALSSQQWNAPLRKNSLYDSKNDPRSTDVDYILLSDVSRHPDDQLL